MHKSKLFYLATFILLQFFAAVLPAQQNRFIAIMPFSNSGDTQYDWLSRGIEEILYDKFSNIGTVTVFEKETFDRVLRSAQVYRYSDLTIRNAFLLGKETGVDVLVAGSYVYKADDIRAAIDSLR